MIAAAGRRRTVLLAATALGSAALAGCAGAGPGGGGAGTGVSPAAATLSASSTAPASPSTSSSGTSADLTTGLLPASAFGNGAEVHTWNESDGRHGFGFPGLPGWWDWDHGDHWPGVDVKPDSCATALDQASKDLGDLGDDNTDAATRVALHDDAVTTESLVQGTVPSVDRLRAVLTACPKATLSGPGSWQVTFTVTPLDVPSLGKGSVAVRTEVSTTGTKDDEDPQRSALLGVAQDGNRLVVLMSTRKDGAAPDEKAFRDLFQQAYEVQAKALD